MSFLPPSAPAMALVAFIAPPLPRPALGLCLRPRLPLRLIRAAANITHNHAHPFPSLLAAAHAVLSTPHPDTKASFTHKAFLDWTEKRTTDIGPAPPPPDAPARPDRPHIVESTAVTKDKDVPFAVFVLHSVAHVELNAIDLSWDTMARFGQEWGMPTEFYEDFLKVADDESRHFGWLQERLRELGSEYGALKAHKIVWESAERTKDSLIDRLALGQLVQEARGLDAGQRLADRLLGTADLHSAKIIKQIAVEEVAHVQIGMRWFLHCCKQKNIEDPIAYFQKAAIKHSNFGAFTPPFNETERRKAGLEPEWYMPVSKVLEVEHTKLMERLKSEKALRKAQR